MKRIAKVVSITLVIMVMVFTLPFGTMPVYAANATQTAGAGGNLTSATQINAWLGFLTGGGNELTFVGDMTVTDQIAIPYDIDLTIKSDGTTRTLTRGSSYEGDLINSAGNITLENIILDGNKGEVTAKNALVNHNYGNFTMSDGVVLQNNKTTIHGGGVVINNGTFTMKGGSIIDNEARGGGSGVLIDTGSTFHMSGGTIANNVTTDASGYGGGGVLTSSATLNISGGTITGNTTTGAPGAGIRLLKKTNDCILNLTGSPQIGTSDTDNGVYVQEGSTITTNLSSGAQVNIEEIENAAADTVVATPISGNVSVQEAEYFHYMPDGLSVIPNIGQNKYVLGVMPVSSIAVTGQGGANSISTQSGTLQMLANVLPVNATDKSVTWSVSGSAATISPNGILTAVGNGTVTVTATANDGSAITGSMMVNISGQVYPFTVNFPTVTDNTQPVSGTINADYALDYGSGNGSSVWVNGVQLTRGKDYTDASGSVVITLLPAFLKTLSNGTYPVTVNFASGGVASTTLVVNINAGSSQLASGGGSPQTGDYDLPALWIALCGMALAGTGLLTGLRIKRRKTNVA